MCRCAEGLHFSASTELLPLSMQDEEKTPLEEVQDLIPRSTNEVGM